MNNVSKTAPFETFYKRLANRRSKSIAKTAATRKLLIRLFIMLRDGIDYAEFKRRGSTVGMPHLSHALKYRFLIGLPTSPVWAAANQRILGLRSINKIVPLCPNRWMSRSRSKREWLILEKEKDTLQQWTKDRLPNKNWITFWPPKLSDRQKCAAFSLDTETVFIDETLFYCFKKGRF